MEGFLLQLQGVGADQVVGGLDPFQVGALVAVGDIDPRPDEGVAQVVAGCQGAVGVTAIEG